MPARRLTPAVATLIALVAGPTTLGAAVHELATAVSESSPTGEGLAEATYQVGNLTLRLAAGRAYALKSGERTLGAFLTGSGSYGYRNTEPLAAANFEANVKRSTKTRVENGELRGEFRPEGRRYRAELNHRMAHEVAHQWWAHVAQMNGWQEQWLSESTAEYYGAVAVGLLVGDKKFKAALNRWNEQAGWVGKADSVYYANLITGERAGLERYGLLYAQGPLILHELRRELGDNAFFTIFKSLLRSFPFETVDTGTFIELTNYVTKKDYGPWIRERLIGDE